MHFTRKGYFKKPNLIPPISQNENKYLNFGWASLYSLKILYSDNQKTLKYEDDLIAHKVNSFARHLLNRLLV